MNESLHSSPRPHRLIGCLTPLTIGQTASHKCMGLTIAEEYGILPDVTYGVANNSALKLDVWQRKDATPMT